MISSRLYRLIYGVIILGCVLAATARHSSSASAGTPVTGGSPAAVALASVTPEGLLAAMLSPADMHELFPSDHAWWPWPPEFDVPPFRSPGAPDAGLRFYVAQDYARLDQPAAVLQQAVTLYDDSTSAAADFVNELNTSDQGGTIISGPALGDAQRYYTQVNDSAAAGGLPDVVDASTVRLQVGPVIVRLTLVRSDGFETPDALARDATPIVTKINLLLAGQLHAPVLSPLLLATLPPNVDGSGPALGTAGLNPEAWAVQDIEDTSGADPIAEAQRDAATLRNGGVTQLVFRRYLLSAAPDDVVEVTLFPFKDAASAASWLAVYGNQVAANPSASRLDAGQTGSTSIFALHDDIYELQFANGRYAVDVSCQAPFDPSLLSPSCGPATRRLAEGWYSWLSTLAGYPG